MANQKEFSANFRFPLKSEWEATGLQYPGLSERLADVFHIWQSTTNLCKVLIIKVQKNSRYERNPDQSQSLNTNGVKRQVACTNTKERSAEQIMCLLRGQPEEIL